MAYPFYLVDAFTNEPFRSNPAGVVWSDQPCATAWMQALAMEINQAETAFLWPISEGFSLRWFTPTVEVDLCGHATLASAHVLWESKRLSVEQPARFFTKSGWLMCHRQDGEIAMDFPAKRVENCEAPAGLMSALGIAGGVILHNKMDYMVVLESEQAVRKLQPDFAELCKVKCRGVIVTAKSDSADADFVSRFFAPQSGIPEDPVTGSSHCALGPYWAEQLGKKTVRGYQASQRGGFVVVEEQGERVVLRGQAVTVVRGELSDQAARAAVA